MSFLFKSKKPEKAGLPPASRGITSSDGSSVPGSGSASYGPSRDGQGSRMANPPPLNNPGMIARGATPDQVALRDQQQQARNNAATPSRPPPDMSLYPWSKRRIEFASPNQSPFPRYGAASNGLASTQGDVYLMGGLINGAMVKGDLWIVETKNGNLTCTPIATMAEGPGPRVGHRALLVGNAFIVFGGDTKVLESDDLDDTLYLLNTSTRHWSRALPQGPRPAGRYGHTLNILGSKIYLFGGQVEGHFFNDLVAFDLNALQSPLNKWEIVVQNSNDGGPPAGQSPPARTNHTIITWNDRLYLFGGTDGTRWYNDVWCYEPRTNSWSCLDCIGFIPAAREGHSAALVGDVMYVFGGRTEEGKDLGDLAAFRIPTKRWYTFQNMGPAPSPRSGHCMTAHDSLIYVLGGEPSSQPEDPNELNLAYILDTAKIRYPADNTQQNGARTGSRRPSVTERSETPQQQRSGSGDGQYPNGNSKLRNGSQDSVADSAPQPLRGPEGLAQPQGGIYGQNSSMRPQRPPGAPPAAAPGGPLGPPPGGPPPTVPMQQPQQVPPQQQQQQQQPLGQPPMGQAPRINGLGFQRPFAGPDGRESPRTLNRPERLAPTTQHVPGGLESASSVYSPRPPPSARDRTMSDPPGSAPLSGQQGPPYGGPVYNNYSGMNPPPNAQPPTGPPNGPVNPSMTSPMNAPMSSAMNGPTNAPPNAPMGSMANAAPGGGSRLGPMNPMGGMQQPPAAAGQFQGSPDRNIPAPAPTSIAPQAEPSAPVRALGPAGQQLPVDSGVGSSPALSQQDHIAQELESLRTKNAWYESELALARKAGYRTNTSDSQGGEERGPTAEDLGEEDKPMMEALLKMRTELINMQETLGLQESSAAERIQRAEKQRDAAINQAVYARTRMRGLSSKDPAQAEERSDDAHRRLALALSTHNDLQARIRSLTTEVDSERKARQLAEESAEVAHARATELDTHKQSSSSELERLRGELHEAEKTVRERTAVAAEHQSQSQMLQVDKNELSARLAAIQSDSQDHTTILANLQNAVTASTEKAALLEKKLEHERLERSSAQEKLAQLKSEHEARVSELETTSQRLQDAEELANSHAAEARTHREAVLAGFGKSSDRAFDMTSHADARVVALQNQLDDANDQVRKSKESADHASERLRKAEERIAGLEAYQEQASREGLSMRKQLQIASRDAVALQSEKADLQEQLTSEKMSATALSVQHGAVKDILAERGIDVSNLSSHGRNRSVDSTVTNERLRELEMQLDASKQAHEEMRSSFTAREAEANRGFEEKLAALDSDYQAAVKYLKVTEKMLNKMKQELHRCKGENRRLEEQVSAGAAAGGAAGEAAAAWDAERVRLQKELDELQERVTSSQEQLEAHMAEASAAVAEREAAQKALADAAHTHETSSRAMREQNAALETRAQEAERRVQTLLDTVGTSVANFRHSQQVNGLVPHPPGGAASSSPSNGAAPAGAGHSRGLSASSTGNDSAYSLGGGFDGAAEGRNSMALDSLASELETLRSHWETTNKNYRSSGQSVMTPATPSVPGAFGPEGESLVSWRKKLDIEEREAESRRDSERSTSTA